MADTALIYKEWGYVMLHNDILLYELNNQNEWVPPQTDITGGLKVDYHTNDAVFVDSDGFTVSSPTEDSYVNIPDGYIESLIAFMRKRRAEETNQIKEMLFWEMEFNKRFNRANRSMVDGTRAVKPRAPYMFTSN